jgi:hypothetical protein
MSASSGQVLQRLPRRPFLLCGFYRRRRSTTTTKKTDGNAPRYRREHHPYATASLLSRVKMQVCHCEHERINRLTNTPGNCGSPCIEPSNSGPVFNLPCELRETAIFLLSAFRPSCQWSVASSLLPVTTAPTAIEGGSGVLVPVRLSLSLSLSVKVMISSLLGAKGGGCLSLTWQCRWGETDKSFMKATVKVILRLSNRLGTNAVILLPKIGQRIANFPERARASQFSKPGSCRRATLESRSSPYTLQKTARSSLRQEKCALHYASDAKMFVPNRPSFKSGRWPVGRAVEEKSYFDNDA